MFGRSWYPAAGAICTLMAVACFMLVSGCGDLDRSPLVSGPDATVQDGGKTAAWKSDQGYIYLSLSGRAAKPAILDGATGLYYLTEAQEFVPTAGGSMGIDFEQPASGDSIRVSGATFTVSPNSIGGLPPLGNGNYLITMKVLSKTTLADIEVQFEPSGLAFTPKAVLQISLEGALNPAVVKAYHVHGSGTTVEQIPVTIVAQGSGWLVTLQIPGFSSYDFWNDGEEDDPPP